MKQWNVGSALGVALLVVALGVGGTVTVAVAGMGQAYCSKTAKIARTACRFDVRDDLALAMANCLNFEDEEERDECKNEANEEKKDGKEECAEVYEARRDVCDLVGEDRYDPDFSPENFVDPDDIGDTVAPNPFLPLVVGAYWILEGGDEVVTDTVLDKTKLIEGVTCRVVLDVVEEDGVVIEITDDWYAQDLEGNVWYCGESARDFEVFEGDEPEEPELVEIDGSFKAGRDGAKPGILVLFAPAVGDAYRQEVSLGDAEDVAEVISITGTESTPAAACDGTCLVTRDFTPLEPGSEETKYYVPGVGLILEVGDDGSRTELVEYMIP
jgi:hypothetical protein